MGEKKKIIIVNNNLDIGGVQCSMINLLNEIRFEYDITLFVFSNSGFLKDKIPKEIKVLEGNKILKLLGISQSDTKNMGIKYYLIRGLLVLWTKNFGNKLPFKLIMQGNFKKKYDYAISYLHSSNEKSFYGGCNEYVLNCIDSNEKITFVHCDFINYGGNTEYNRNLYRLFDKIVFVSKGCKERFLNVMPELESKSYCIRNFNNHKYIIDKSLDKPIEYDSNCLNIITVSRLSKEKGVLRCIPIISELLKKGYKLKWHIVGDGSMAKEINEKIKKEKLEKQVIVYGNKINPYRYMRNADLFLLTSYHEAAPMVFDEAKILSIPILATKTISTTEMIKDCKAGWVCENNDNDIKDTLTYILDNPNELKIIKFNLRKNKLTNSNSLMELKKLLT